jgi:3-hydroxyisobutyrate dehydrogenase
MADKSKAVQFKMNDLVWAKMPSYCHWPGRIVEPNTPQIAKLKKSPTQHCIFFFGSNNYAWLEEKSLKPFYEFKEEMKAKGKPKDLFAAAMNDIESFIENPENFSALFEAKTPVQKKKSAPKPKIKHDIEADFDSLISDNSVPSSPSPSKTSTQITSRKSIDKPKSEKVPQTKRKSTRESDTLLNEDMDIEPTAQPAAKKPRKSSQAPISSPKPNEKNPEESRRRSDVTDAAKALKSPRRTEASLNVYGLIGVGIMGSTILENLLASGHEVVIYNRTQSKCDSFISEKCTMAGSPREVFEQSYVTFICVSDCDAVKEVVCDGERGIIAADCGGIEKGLVMLSSVDCETSRDIHGAVLMKDCRYLEAQIQGSKSEVKGGKAIVISAGEKSLHDDCKTCFNSFAKNTYYLGEEPETAVKMNLILQSMAGVQLAALTEALTLADSLGLQLRDILEIIGLSNLNSDFIAEKGLVIVDEKFREPSKKVDTMQNDLKMALEFGDTLEQPLPLVGASKEVFKSAKRMGFGSEDCAAVYFALNFNKYCYDYGNYTENGTM